MSNENTVVIENNRINAIEEYLKYFPNDRSAKNNLLLCKYSDELGLKLGGYYPKIEYDRCVINDQINACKKYHLINSTTDYEHNNEDTVVVWRESVGKYMFASNNDEYYAIQEEWDEFINILKSYDPLDYDKTNDIYIYNVTNGKKLINDYNDIIKSVKEKIDKKLDKIKTDKKREQFEKLKKELGE